MPNYIRKYLPGGTFFFTVVTEGRRPILATDMGRTQLREAMEYTFENFPVSIETIVLLPDHLHTIWTLPEGDSDYSTRWGLIKERFTRPTSKREELKLGNRPLVESIVSGRCGRGGFWEHTIRDEADFERCFDYIHWNPVKHGFVSRVRDYQWSSFHRHVAERTYDLDWGLTEPQDVPGAEWE